MKKQDRKIYNIISKCQKSFCSTASCNTNVKRKVCAFTLAEALVTIAIIGVVVALTIPIVVQTYQEKRTVMQLKKVYSQLNSAYQMAISKYGSPETWDWGAASNTVNVVNIMKTKFIPYLKILKNCENTDHSCFYDNAYKTLNTSINWGNNNPNRADYARILLSDGTAVWLLVESNNCTAIRGSTKTLKNICASIGVDLNGEKPPNRFGRDTFYFRITKFGIYPMGMETNSYYTLSDHCKLTSTNIYNGYACAAWIIENGNMDYLHKNVLW